MTSFKKTLLSAAATLALALSASMSNAATVNAQFDFEGKGKGPAWTLSFSYDSEAGSLIDFNQLQNVQLTSKGKDGPLNVYELGGTTGFFKYDTVKQEFSPLSGQGTGKDKPHPHTIFTANLAGLGDIFVTAPGGKNKFQLFGAEKGTLTNGIFSWVTSNVVVVPQPIAAVPLPAAGLLLVGALGGLMALRRKKAAPSA